MFDALVLCAGTGSRMGTLTANCPKPLLPLAGRPALFWILDWLHSGGVKRVTLNVHYLPEAFYQTVGEMYRGMTLSYLVEPSLLGSAGTLRHYLKTYPDKPVLVACGDVLTTLPLERLQTFHAARPIRPAATLVVHAVPDPHTGGVVTLEGERIVSFQEKPAQPASSTVYAGIALLDPQILSHLPEIVPLDLGSDVFPRLCANLFPVNGYQLEARDYLIDFGTPERYPRACQEWQERIGHGYIADPTAG